MPFSDPLADGPVIQRATERALAAGGSLSAALSLIEQVRPAISAPIVVFSYANPLLRMGIDAFARRAAAAGVDGVLALDLPIEEAAEFRETLASVGTRYDISAESDDDRRSDPEGGRARARVPVRDLTAGRHRRPRPRGDRGRGDGPPDPRRTPTCRWRSGSASRGPSTWRRSARTPTPPSSAARWCRSSRKRAGRPI